MKIIERYISRELLIPFMVVVVLLTGLFASFSSARLLAGAVTETLGLSAMLKLVLLKTLIALEVLVPIALYVAVIIGLGRLNKDQEINVLRSSGVSGKRIIYAVLIVAIPVGIISGILSIYLRPWAYAESYILNAQAEAELNTNRFQAGRFYGSVNSGRVIYVRNKDDANNQMANIFHYIKKNDHNEIIVAKEAQQQLTPNQRPRIQLSDGYIYRLTHAATKDDVIKFEKMTYFTDINDVSNYRRKATTTRILWESDQPREIAELQWRLSRPIATILLALIAASFIRTAPRQDKSDRTYFIAAMVFAIYYNLSGLAQTWVEQGVVSSMPGIWWLYLLMAGGLGLLSFGPVQKRLSR
ncbi:lipopolysaccharide export system permease protein [Nitrosomonas cryotolerans]|uniref:Lipopolysaccharide export system permease protein LptF n=1 Tax=Nitrosomonas cryotolerans ATCC 49181 TaxID=1131553 RepID=A0A1N6HA55_9PROT|nr:LPS export ABC transporter permease LptF [Nitrosomonas cryotolerans]SFQ15046.1 lipopolysaccharide export system permease protein [Nitrosomonas cryotolerans]SIO16708.1 lipopolysaccharide export system permease protein [Nitrosomonas cryotolerans ATCC 49181]